MIEGRASAGHDAGKIVDKMGWSVRRDIRHLEPQRKGGNQWPETVIDRNPVFYPSWRYF